MPVEQIAGQYLVTPPTFGDGQTIAVQVDAQGRLLVGGSAGGTPVPVGPSFGGNASTQTAATGTNYTALASHECTQVTIANNTGTNIGVTVGGTGAEQPVFAGTYYTFYGLQNSNELSLRRVDTSNTQVTVTWRYEG